MDFMKAIAVLIAGRLPLAVADRAVRIAPCWQASVAVIRIGVDLSAGVKRGPKQRLDRGLLDVLQQADDHLAAALKPSQDWRLLRLQRAAPTGALQAAPPSPAACFKTASGWPLCPATT